MRKLILASALSLASMAFTLDVQSKEWTWTAYDLNGDKVVTVGTGATCNYQSSIAAGRAAAQKAVKPAFYILGQDNATTCPTAADKRKQAAAVTADPAN